MTRITPFDLSYENSDCVRRKRHGLPWTKEDYTLLDDCVGQGRWLSDMCHLLQRSAAGIVPKLRSRGYLDSENFLRYPPVSKPNNESTNTMNPDSVNNRTTPTIENRTLIQGKDASTMDDAEIFQLIAKLEGKIDSLKQIKAQSKKLAAHIEELQADVNKLVEFVDGR